MYKRQVFGVIYAPLVITGLHHMSNAIDLQLIADYGGTMLWPMIALSNICLLYTSSGCGDQDRRGRSGD